MIHKNKIKYVGFYDSDDYSHENRDSYIAATNKMDYIAQTMVALGNEVEITSPSWTGNKKGYYHKRITTVADGITLICGSTFGANNRLFRYFRILWSWVWLFVFLIKKARVAEPVIVYHSMMIMAPIMLAKKITNFELILEVEEIYQDVQNFSRFMKHNEYEFFKMADKFIFPTEFLNEKLNKDNKQFAIVYGTYKIEQYRECKHNDGKIHVVYAGTFDPRKGGAAAAAAAAEFLPKDYHMHILGFGSEKEKTDLLEIIEKVNKKGDCRVSYDGLLSGEAYIKFLQKCDIGLSTQNPDAAFNATSFPSKILSYMANGLRVVSIRIPVIEISAIGKEVFYYEEQTPQAIAEAIKMIDLTKLYDSRQLIKELDEDFKNKIKDLLES